MKRNKLFILVATLCFMGVFCGCSNDDDPLYWPGELNQDFGGLLFTNATLNVNYGGEPLFGKKVEFYTSDSKTATLTLKEVIPGEVETVIEGVELTAGEGVYNLSGETTTTTGAVVSCTGTVSPTVLDVNFDVNLADRNGWAGSYKLGDYTTGPLEAIGMSRATLTSAMYMNWEIEDEYCSTIFPVFVRAIGGVIFPQLIKSVTLEADGNIRAEYSTSSLTVDPSIIMGMMFTGMAPSAEEVNALIPTDGWVSSPKNLVHWFEKDGKLFLKLNLSAIVAQSMVMSENMGKLVNEILPLVLNKDVATLKNLLGKLLAMDLSSISDETFAMLIDWVRNGIPLNLVKTEGHTYIHLDKAAFDPIMTDRALSPDDDSFGTKSDLMMLWQILSEAAIIPEDAQAAIILLIMMPQNWPDTQAFDLGLDLVAQ